MIPRPGDVASGGRPRIVTREPSMRLRRVKQVSQLHAPRVRFAYIKPIPRPCKWRFLALLPKRRRETIQSFLPGYGVSRMMVPGETGPGGLRRPQDGRGNRARTCDLRFWRPPLYQLSYTPKPRYRQHSLYRSAGCCTTAPKTASLRRARLYPLVGRASRVFTQGGCRHPPSGLFRGSVSRARLRSVQAVIP